MASRPDRFPAFAAGVLSASDRAEPTGGTASNGYGAFAEVPHEDFNWLFWRGGLWAKYLDEASVHASDIHDPGTGYAYRISAAGVAATVAGGLAQQLASGGVYLLDGARLEVIPASVGTLTYADNTTNYIHIRSSADTERRNCADVLVSTNASEAGYQRVQDVVTLAGVVTASTEPTGGPGPVEVWLPEQIPTAKTGWLSIDQDPALWGGPEGLRVDFANSLSVAAGVVFAAKAGATQGAVQIEPDVAGAFGVRVLSPGAGAPVLVQADQTGIGSNYAGQFTHSDGGIALLAQAAQGGGGAAGKALRVNADSGAAGAEFASINAAAQAPVRIVPQALAPATPTEGDIHVSAGGAWTALRFLESGLLRSVFSGQDGIAPYILLSTGTITLPPSTGPTNLQAGNYFFRQNGQYLVLVGCLQGGDANVSTLVQYDVRINATALPGVNARVVDPAFGQYQANTGLGPYFTSYFAYPTIYTHLLADGSYAVDFRATTTAGLNDREFTNRVILIFALTS